MPKPRLHSSLAVGGVLICLSMNTPAQEVIRGEANLLHRAPLEYPADALAKGIQGTVVVEATLNERGIVSDARVLSGPGTLRRAALKSVLDWHYSTVAQSPVEIAIDFKLPSKRVAVAGIDSSGAMSGVIGGVSGAMIGGVSGAMIGGVAAPGHAQIAESKKVKRIQFTGISSQLREALEGRLPVREGDEIQVDTLARVKQAVLEVDEHLDVRISRAMNTDGGWEYVLQIVSTAPMVAAASTERAQRIRVGGNVQQALLIFGPKPAYPPLAKKAHVQGTVKLSVILNRDGTVQDIQVISGHPLLVEAALDVVRQWVYKPTMLNGDPVEVATVVDVNFTLTE